MDSRKSFFVEEPCKQEVCSARAFCNSHLCNVNLTSPGKRSDLTALPRLPLQLAWMLVRRERDLKHRT